MIMSESTSIYSPEFRSVYFSLLSMALIATVSIGNSFDNDSSLCDRLGVLRAQALASRVRGAGFAKAERPINQQSLSLVPGFIFSQSLVHPSHHFHIYCFCPSDFDLILMLILILET